MSEKNRENRSDEDSPRDDHVFNGSVADVQQSNDGQEQAKKKRKLV